MIIDQTNYKDILFRFLVSNLEEKWPSVKQYFVIQAMQGKMELLT